MSRGTRILIAVDKYKGCLPAGEVARHLAAGLTQALPDADIRLHPVSDGGDGFATELFRHGFQPRSAEVRDPLGRPVDATYAVRNGTAVIEMAASSGLVLLGDDELAPLEADTLGLGMLIRAALGEHPRRIVVGAGGSATSDGGAGALAGLGAVIEHIGGSPARYGPRSIHGITGIDLDPLDLGGDSTLVEIATDVTNPLLGPDGAAAVFGPQKGASPDDIIMIEEGLRHWADVMERATGRSGRDLPRSGAAGGMAFGMSVALGAELCDGLDVFADLSGLAEAVDWADVVITGEGSLDEQSTAGKAPVGVLRYARSAGTPCWAVAGRSSLSNSEVAALGFVGYLCLASYAKDEESSVAEAARWLRIAGSDLGVRLGSRGPHSDMSLAGSP